MRAWMSIAPPGGFGTTRFTVRAGKVCAAAVPSAVISTTAPKQPLAIIVRIVNSAHEVRAGPGGAGEALGWEPAAALAADARPLFTLHHRVAGAMVGPCRGARIPRRAQRRRLAQGELSGSVRRRAAHRPGAARSRTRPVQAGRDPFRQRRRPRPA